MKRTSSLHVTAAATTVAAALIAVATLSACSSTSSSSGAAAATGMNAMTASSGTSGPSGTSGTSGSVAGAVQRVTVHATDQLRFAPDTVRVHTGRVELTLVNDGSYPHNLAIPTLHAQTSDVSGTPGSQQATLAFDVSSPGTYQFVCTYHAGAGMRGTLTVTK